MTICKLTKHNLQIRVDKFFLAALKSNVVRLKKGKMVFLETRFSCTKKNIIGCYSMSDLRIIVSILARLRVLTESLELLYYEIIL